MCKSRKLDLREKKSVMAKAHTKCARDVWVKKTQPTWEEICHNRDISEMCSRCVSQKNQTHVRINLLWRRHKPNVLEMHKSGKLDPREKKSITIEVYDEMCLRRISWKNPTHIRRNPLWWKYRPNVLEMCEFRKLIQHEEKSIMAEAQGKMCLRHMN